MEISTKLFNQRAVQQFSRMNEDIQNLQNRVATGKNILRASDDPIAAVNLSVAKEQKALIERFEKNAASARQTLDLTDGALAASCKCSNKNNRVGYSSRQRYIWHS